MISKLTFSPPHYKATYYYVASKKVLFYFTQYISNQSDWNGDASHDRRNDKLREKKKYAAHFKILELPEDSGREAVRHQYINLVKKYHPDAINVADENLEKFHSIDKAYKELQKFFALQAKQEEDCEGEYGIYYKVLIKF